jgi:hypothetical protein
MLLKVPYRLDRLPAKVGRSPKLLPRQHRTIDFIRNKYFINGYKSRVNEKMGKQPIPVTHGILQGTLAFLLEQINQSWGQIFIRIDSHNKLLILRRLSVLYFE